MKNESPNILLILTDQQRFDSLSCTGNTGCRTPNIDSLADNGVNFSQAFTCTVPCSPSRASLFTGVYPQRHGVVHNNLQLETPELALPTRLSQRGYQLGFAGKWHVDDALLPSDYGFASEDLPGYGYPAAGNEIDGLRFAKEWQKPTNTYSDYLESHSYSQPRLLSAYYGENPGRQQQELYGLLSGGPKESFEHMIFERTLDLIDQFTGSTSESPFFIWTNFFGPHTPCILPEPYYSMYDPEGIQLPESIDDPLENKPYIQQLYRRFWGLESAATSQWQQIIAEYYGYVSFIDDLVGGIIRHLKELDVLDNTLIIFTSDHGEMLGAHGLIEKGPFAYDESYRIPLIIKPPEGGVERKGCDDFVYLHDVYNTILEYAGADAPDNDAESLCTGLKGEGVFPARDAVFCTFDSHIFPAPHRMIRTNNHKLVFNRCDRGELYDLIADPLEQKNEFSNPEYTETRKKLISMLRDELIAKRDPILKRFNEIIPVY